MKKWNLVIDVAECFSCQMCALCCHDEYGTVERPGYAAKMPKRDHHWIDIKRRVRGTYPMLEVTYVPVMCNHCDDAPCVKAAENGAVVKRADGVVLIDPEKAKGQKHLVDACPYGAIWWNEERDLPQSWPFDAHLLDSGWTETRGSQVCPTKAMQTYHVTDAEMERLVAAEGLRVLHPEYGTKPRVYYKNLDRYEKAFVGGSVAGDIDGVNECVAGARVVLMADEETIVETQTDMFGDFRIDGLPQKSGPYRIEISDERFTPKTVDFELEESLCLGTIEL